MVVRDRDSGVGEVVRRGLGRTQIKVGHRFVSMSSKRMLMAVPVLMDVLLLAKRLREGVRARGSDRQWVRRGDKNEGGPRAGMC